MSMNFLKSPEYVADASRSIPRIISTGEFICSEESEALDDLQIFLGILWSKYDENGYAGRRDCVQDFSSHTEFISKEMFFATVRAHALEMIEAIRDGVMPIALHTGDQDAKDHRVGSSEYIFGHVADVLNEHGYGLNKHYKFLSPSELVKESDKVSPVYVFDDWLITGGQMKRTVGSLDGQAGRVNVRLSAMRDGNQAAQELAQCVNSLSYVYPFDSVTNIARGPSIIGFHSSVNIGWQNVLAVYALDLSYMLGRPVKLPALGNIVRPYRTRLDMPRYYRDVQEKQLLAYAKRTGANPGYFPEFELKALISHFKTTEDKTV